MNPDTKTLKEVQNMAREQNYALAKYDGTNGFALIGIDTGQYVWGNPTMPLSEIVRFLALPRIHATP